MNGIWIKSWIIVLIYTRIKFTVFLRILGGAQCTHTIYWNIFTIYVYCRIDIHVLLFMWCGLVKFFIIYVTRLSENFSRANNARVWNRLLSAFRMRRIFSRRQSYRIDIGFTCVQRNIQITTWMGNIRQNGCSTRNLRELDHSVLHVRWITNSL